MSAPLSLPLPGAQRVRVVVLAGYGLDCEAETSAAFELTGACAEVVHTADVLERGDAAFAGVDLIVFGGGFSFGDHIASGRVLANRVRYRLGDALARHVDGGGLVLGICNGFQTLVKLGLLPGLAREEGQPLAAQEVSIVHNDRLGYRNDWVRLRVEMGSPCVFTRGLAGEILEMPSRHGEGKLVIPPQVERELAAQQLIPVRYVDPSDAPTQAWPHNPNGSPGGAAGLCDRSGRVFGIMPHPEAYLYPENHPHWLAQKATGTLPPTGLGLRLLAAGVRAALER